MAYSSLSSIFNTMRALECVSPPDNSSLFLTYVAVVKAHSLEFGLAILTTVGTRYLYTIFKRANVFKDLDGPTPNSLLWGDEGLLFDFETSLTVHDRLLNTYGSACKIKGILGEDRIWIADPRAMDDIVLKGVDTFKELEGFIAWNALTTGPSLITTDGHKHKMHRKILNPVFTAAHMRNLVLLSTPTFQNITRYLEDIITSKVQVHGRGTEVVDMYHWMSNVALEMIGQAGMGHSFGVMEGNEPEYLDASRKLFPLISEMWYLRPILPTLMKIGPARFRRCVVECLPFSPIQRMKKVTDIMDETATIIYNRKKCALENGTFESEIAAGNDIMSMLRS
ncbi:unnamed protein product [Rhizoctonia solani]|uniref:Cytochrome P450 n=1 Tax=Rhizoctonia solani TaxID=456999 RepID=A0A8H3C8X6_9AGAM|nr:unnamed protein product [Rhizoctonia solani]